MLNKLLTHQKPIDSVNCPSAAYIAFMATRKVARLKKQFSASLSDLLKFPGNFQQKAKAKDEVPALHNAVITNNLYLLEFLLEQSFDVNMRDQRGSCAIHYAAIHGNLECIKLLLTNGADAKVADFLGNSPLHLSSLHGHTESVQILMDHAGVTADLANAAGLTPLDLACEYGKFCVASILLTRTNVSDVKNAFQLAAKNGNIDILKLLIQYGFGDTNDSRSLHSAAAGGKLDAVVFLLSNGFDPSLEDFRGRMPLDIIRKKVKSAEYPYDLIARFLKEAHHATYAITISDHRAIEKDHISFDRGAIVWVIDKDSNDKTWTGALIGLKSSYQTGKFPASKVQLIHQKGVMQRTTSQRKVKKVGIPEIPSANDVKRLDGRSLAPTTNCWSSASNLPDPCQIFGDNDAVFTVKMNQFSSDNAINHALPTPTKNALCDKLRIADQQPNQCQHNVVQQCVSNMITSSPLRNRNSTGSTSSHGSSGFESMKSGSQPTSNIAVSSLRGDSPPSRNSIHSSSGSSSLGSLERLDETNCSIAQLNVAQMLRDGVPEPEIIFAWLHNLHYEEYSALFINAGYDLTTISRMTPEDLTAIGITKPGHRKRLTTEIHRMNIKDNWPDYKTSSITEWLTALGLTEYIAVFIDQKYDFVDKVTQLTWEDFEDIGVKKLGHLKKLVCAIKKIKDKRSHCNGQRVSSLSSEGCLNEVASSHISTDSITPSNGELLTLNLPNLHNDSPVVSGYNDSSHSLVTFQQSPRHMAHLQESLPPFSPSSHRTRNASNHQTESRNGIVAPSWPSASPARRYPSLSRSVLQRATSVERSIYSYAVAKTLTTNDARAPTTANRLDGAAAAVERQAAEDSLFKKYSSGAAVPYSTLERDGTRCAPAIRCDVIASVVGDNLPSSPISASCENLTTTTATQHYASASTSCVAATTDFAALTSSRRRRSAQSVAAVGSSSRDRVDEGAAAIHSRQSYSSDRFGAMPPGKPPAAPFSCLGNRWPRIFKLSAQRLLMMSQQPPGDGGDGSGAGSGGGSGSNVSPAQSVEEFPPPPDPITCEQQIRQLRTIQGQQESSADRRNSEFGDLGAAAGRNSSKCKNTSLTSRNNSNVSMDSNSSTETLPFAQENIGTIRQKAGGPSCASPIEDQLRAPTLIRPPISNVFSDIKQNGSPPLANSNCKPGNVLSDIGDMLQGLTDELDAMLCEPLAANHPLPSSQFQQVN